MILTKVPFTTSYEAWFLDGLRQLSNQLDKPINEIIEDAVLLEYPELKDLRRGFIGRVLGKVSASGSPG